MAIKRQQLVDAWKARLQTIATPTYRTDVGANVTVWNPGGKQKGSFPTLDIRDESNTRALESTFGGDSAEDHELVIRVYIGCNPGTLTDTQVREIIQDIRAAVKTDETFGGLAYMTHYLGDEIQIEQESLLIGGATVEFISVYRTTKFGETTP